MKQLLFLLSMIVMWGWVKYFDKQLNKKTMGKINNWKTTLFGAIGGIMIAAQPLLDAYKAGAFDGKTGGQLAAAVAIVFLGVYSKDKNVTGGTTPQ